MGGRRELEESYFMIFFVLSHVIIMKALLLYIIILILLIILNSELKREKFPKIHCHDIKTGDLVYFSSRPYHFFPKIGTLGLRLFNGNEFDHIGLIIIEDHEPYILERRGNGSVSYEPLKHRLDNFHGYVCIRPLFKKLSRKKERLIQKLAKTYITEKIKSFPFWRIMAYAINSSKKYSDSSWVDCNDLVSSILSQCKCKYPNIFPKNQNKKSDTYDHLKSLILK